jgi:hypothetical protein
VGDRLAAGSPDLFDDLRALLDPAGAEGHRVACSGQRQRRGGPDPRGRPADHGRTPRRLRVPSHLDT